jgi:hypothetical protein
MSDNVLKENRIESLILTGINKSPCKIVTKKCFSPIRTGHKGTEY